MLTSSQEDDGAWLEPLVKRVPRAFATDGRPEQHGHTIDHLSIAEAAMDKAFLLADLR
jgi:hypothetical protein